MIQFTCEHCRQPVRVDDVHRGKKGRCPHCKQVVSIPGGADALDALAAALTREQANENDDTSVGYVPPPPPVEGRILEEEFLLPGEADEDLADTIILPAEGAAAPESPLPAPTEKPIRHLPHRPPTAINAKLISIIIAVTIVVLTAAGVGLYIVVHFHNR